MGDNAVACQRILVAATCKGCVDICTLLEMFLYILSTPFHSFRTVCAYVQYVCMGKEGKQVL